MSPLWTVYDERGRRATSAAWYTRAAADRKLGELRRMHAMGARPDADPAGLYVGLVSSEKYRTEG